MSTPFSRSMRSLELDSFRLTLVALSVAVLLLMGGVARAPAGGPAPASGERGPGGGGARTPPSRGGRSLGGAGGGPLDPHAPRGIGPGGGAKPSGGGGAATDRRPSSQTEILEETRNG